MSNAVIWIRAALLLTIILLPSVFVFIFVMRAYKARQRSSGFTFSLLMGAAALANWFLFVSYLLTDQFVGAVFHSYVSEFVIAILTATVLLVALSNSVQVGRWMLVSCNLVVLFLWFAFAYTPQHWFWRTEIGSASVGDRATPVVVYIANPRESEAESIALVAVPDVGNYFIDFRDETFRRASKFEFLPLHYGIWTWRAAPQGTFRQPLPYQQVNQTRIGLADGQVLSIDF
jgi:hypothetical protein